MKIDDAITEVKQFASVLKSGCPGMAFEVTEVVPWDGPFNKWFRKEVPGKDASKQSGIYLITDTEGTILYIGKAGAGNLAAEIYGKFSAATKVDDNDVPEFGKSSLAKWAGDNHQKEHDLIVHGNVLIRAVIVQPKEFASLAEVYLHIWCDRNHNWPILNKRIG